MLPHPPLVIQASQLEWVDALPGASLWLIPELRAIQFVPCVMLCLFVALVGLSSFSIV
jgi:hypothetical protein